MEEALRHFYEARAGEAADDDVRSLFTKLARSAARSRFRAAAGATRRNSLTVTPMASPRRAQRPKAGGSDELRDGIDAVRSEEDHR